MNKGGGRDSEKRKEGTDTKLKRKILYVDLEKNIIYIILIIYMFIFYNYVF